MLASRMLYDQQGADLARLRVMIYLRMLTFAIYTWPLFFIGAVLEREGERTAAEQPASFNRKRGPAACGAVLF